MKNKVDSHIYVAMVGMAGWIVPGAGHFIIGKKIKAMVIFVGITAAFAIGLWIGSIAVISPVKEWLWFIPQMMVSPFVKIIGSITVSRELESFGRPNEIGQIYTSMAGMLNLLCVVNAVYLAHTKKFPPQEESEK